MRTTLFATLILVLGCNLSMQSGAPGDLTLDVEPWTVSAGDSLTLTLRNTLTEAVGYNLCSSALEREDAGGWQPVPSDRACTMELRTLEPGDEAAYDQRVDPSLEPGEYRFRTTVELLETGTRRDVTSEAFTVRP